MTIACVHCDVDAETIYCTTSMTYMSTVMLQFYQKKINITRPFMLSCGDELALGLAFTLRRLMVEAG